MDAPTYDPRYLAGILFFNRHDFFEAHEVWENLWGDCNDRDRRFYGQPTRAWFAWGVTLYLLGFGLATQVSQMAGGLSAY